MTLERRAKWLHRSCKRVVTAMGIRCEVKGAVPTQGLLVSNHLSYLDIAIYGAVTPVFFIAKAEIANWPYFGRAARTGGALFVDRSRRSSASDVARQMEERLRLPAPVLLFPEGTSTDGSEVLRFHSGLFEPAVAQKTWVTAAAISYRMDGGVAERELCWFGDALFLPHLWKTLGTRGLSTEVRFQEPTFYADRRTAAERAHSEVARMREQMRDSGNSQVSAEPILSPPRAG